MKLLLTQQEEAIFKALLSFNAATGRKTVYRVAGGWVRDCLLGRQSDDIDIALDDCTGSEFAAEFMKSAKNVGKVYVVAANPDKSKHLETVAVEILGKKIDFVNLRSETYGESRIPTMEMGTPKSDAERRDLTMNALFYNVNSGEVEDYVGGLKDLQNTFLRTPLDPKKTFLDDPLRILRTFRFFSKFDNAVMDPEILKAVADPEVQAAYKDKVAPERASPELIKILAGKRPASALRLMFETGFDKALFSIPEMNGVELRMEQKNKHHAHDLLEHTLRVVEGVEFLTQHEPDNVRVRMLFAALFHDFGKAVPGIAQPKASNPEQFTYLGHEDESAKIADSFMNSIGIPKDDRDFVNKVVSMHMRVHAHVHAGEWTKKSIGKFIRESQVPGQESVPVWRYVFLHGIADSMAKGTPDAEEDAETKRQVLSMFDGFKHDLGKDVNVPKALLNGFDLMKLFPSIKANKIVEKKNFIAFITEALLDEQADGVVTDKEQAFAWIEMIRERVELQYA